MDIIFSICTAYEDIIPYVKTKVILLVFLLVVELKLDIYVNAYCILYLYASNNIHFLYSSPNQKIILCNVLVYNAPSSLYIYFKLFNYILLLH